MSRQHRPGGIYRRRVEIETISPGVVRAALEDDFHHFVVEVTFDKGVVSAIEGRALRHPWTTCPGASERLRDFLGQPASTSIIRRKDVTDVSQQCTHQHDLAVLAIAHAARGEGRTVYEITVPDRPDRTLFPRIENGVLYRITDFDGHTTATLDHDGARVLTWHLDGLHVAEMDGLDYRKAGRWGEDHDVDDQTLEHMKVLRQGIFVAGGRANDVDLVLDPESSLERASRPPCFVFQPIRLKSGRRVIGSTLDFTDRGEALLK